MTLDFFRLQYSRGLLLIIASAAVVKLRGLEPLVGLDLIRCQAVVWLVLEHSIDQTSDLNTDRLRVVILHLLDLSIEVFVVASSERVVVGD